MTKYKKLLMFSLSIAVFQLNPSSKIKLNNPIEESLTTLNSLTKHLNAIAIELEDINNNVEDNRARFDKFGDHLHNFDEILYELKESHFSIPYDRRESEKPKFLSEIKRLFDLMGISHANMLIAAYQGGFLELVTPWFLISPAYEAGIKLRLNAIGYSHDFDPSGCFESMRKFEEDLRTYYLNKRLYFKPKQEVSDELKECEYLRSRNITLSED